MINPLAARRARRSVNPDGSMSLIEHLYELRRRLTIAALGLLVGGTLGFLWFNSSPFGLSSLADILTDPYCSLPSDQRATLTADDNGCSLLATGVFEPFFLQLKVGLTAGAVLSSPIWLGQLWGFITPGLYTKERKFASIFVGVASVLFASGAVLAYYVVAKGLQFLLSFSQDAVTVALSPNEYFGFVITLLIIFGVSFELPLLVVMLNRIGVLPAESLKRWRRGIVMALFVFAAVATPGGDPISMVALAVSLSLLFELARWVATVHDKRENRRLAAEGLLDLDDDEASPMTHVPDRVEPAEAVTRYDDAT